MERRRCRGDLPADVAPLGAASHFHRRLAVTTMDGIGSRRWMEVEMLSRVLPIVVAALTMVVAMGFVLAMRPELRSGLLRFRKTEPIELESA